MLNLEKVGDPAFEAVTVDELKAHCRIFGTTDDDYLDVLRVSAREQVEQDLQMAVVQQAYILHLDNWIHPRQYRRPYRDYWCYQAAHITLPIQPVSAVGDITYTDQDGNPQTLDPSLYTVKLFQDPPVVLLTGELPGTQSYSDILVNLTAGFADANTVPAILKHAIYFLAAHWYEHREAQAETVMRDVPLGYERIINRFNVKRFK